MDNRRDRPQTSDPDPIATREGQQALRARFCSYLIEARKRRDMSLQDIANVTRIPARSLERLESGRFEDLPADVFVRGFLRSYARCVGLDVHETTRRYAECGMTPAPVSSPLAAELIESMAALAPEHAAACRTVRGASADRRVPQFADAVGSADAARRSSDAAPDVRDDVRDSDTREATPARDADAGGSRPNRARRRRRRRRRKQRAAQGDKAQGAQARAEIVAPKRIRETAESEASDASAEVQPSLDDARGDDNASATEARVDDATHAAAHDGADGAAEVSERAQESAANATDDATASDDAVAARGASDETDEIDECDETDESAGSASGDDAAPSDASQGVTTVTPPRPILVIDDDDPDAAERVREARAGRDADTTRRSFLPPILLDNEDGSRNGALTLAVIILVIVATLTMSYLLRRPSDSGDGVTRAPAAEPAAGALALADPGAAPSRADTPAVRISYTR